MLDVGVVARLVESDRVHRAVYADPALFELEMERLFGRAWLVLGRTVHQVANVRLRADDGLELTVGSTLVVEYRAERQRLWGAVVEHRLRRTPDGLRIAAKRVDLVNSEAELDGIVCLF